MTGTVTTCEFEPAWWLPGPHSQTIWPNTFRRPIPLDLSWEEVRLSDGDFIELAWTGPESGPIAVLLHGLGGSAESPPLRGIARRLVQDGFRVAIFHFRGCGRRPNEGRFAYHSGRTEDPREVLRMLRARHPGRLLLALGVSLGGNVLLRLLGEDGEDAPVDVGVAISVPFVLSTCCARMDTGFSQLYQKVLLDRLKELIGLRAEFWATLPGVDIAATLSARSFEQFDDAFTAPVHGFEDAQDYYARCSSRPILSQIRKPTLLIQAADDPFMGPGLVPTAGELSPLVKLELSDGGGHVGFVSGTPSQPVFWLEERVARLGAVWTGRVGTGPR